MNNSEDMVIQLDGVYFKKNDETEFRRVLIQNFVKQGNLAPLTNSSQVESERIWSIGTHGKSGLSSLRGASS